MKIMKINQKTTPKHSLNLSFLKIFPYIALSACTVFLCWLFAGRLGVFGSKIDWLSQHSVLPDYFRQQFYETGSLIPEFAPSLGGGQNIYNFSYYGLFSPLILPSYLLPFVKMSSYMIAVSILSLTVSVLLFYYWLGTHGFSKKLCFCVSLLFLLAGPMIFQSYRQIMFVNYMPFLILALIGVDSFWKRRCFMLFTAGIFLMILTSFYFSIGGMLVLFIYGIAKFPVKCQQKVRAFCQFLMPFFSAVFTAAFLLVPSACTLPVRSGSSKKINFKNLFIPDFSLKHFTYTGYGIGLSAGILAVLILGIFILKRSEKIMSVLCLIVLTLPLFSWILNGGLYLRDKAFIPFLPLLCYLTASFLQSLKTQRILFFRKINPIFLLAPFLIYLTAAGLYLNETDGSAAEKDFCSNLWDSSWKSAVREVLDQEKGLYRLEQDGSCEEKKFNMNRIWDSRQWTAALYSSTYNHEYQDFLKDTFQAELPYNNAISHASSANPVFRRFMGVKSLIQKSDNGDFSVETLESAAPVLYATDRLLSQKDYESLSFPYNQTGLLEYAVTEKTTSFSPAQKENIKNSAAPVEIAFPANSLVQKAKSEYRIQTDKTTNTHLLLQNSTKAGKKLFFLQFDVKNNRPKESFYIEVNGMRNKLSSFDHLYYNNNHTFTFVTELDAGQTEIPVTFSKGDYALSNIKSYIGKETLLTDNSLYQSEFQPDWDETKGNRIAGQITAEKDSYAVTSIPFDKGFEILIDGVSVSLEKINTAFLGFPLPKGVHRLELIYHAPGLPLGKQLSLIGILLWILQGIPVRNLRCRHSVIWPKSAAYDILKS